MKLKTIPLTVIVILSLILTNLYKDMSNVQPPNKVYLTIKNIEGVWRVVDANNNSRIIVHKGSQVTWISPASDVAFQFPTKVKQILAPDSTVDRLPDGYTKYVKAGHKIKFHIKMNAPTDTLEYAVFVIKGRKYAKGQSPPKIIIQ
jgi:hypothetical protein